MNPALHQQLESLIELGFWLDHRYRIPFTKVGIGWDSLIGFVPFAGGIITFAIATRIILAAHRLKIGNRRLARMLMHTGIDVLVGMIPLAGVILDIFYRSNLKNLRILLDHFAELSRERSGA